MNKNYNNLNLKLKTLLKTSSKQTEKILIKLIEDKDFKMSLINCIEQINTNFKLCYKCHSITTTDNPKCNFCENSNRNSGVLYIVENFNILKKIEEIENNKNIYFTLNNLDNVDISNFSCQEIIDFIKNKEIKEIVICLSPSPKGEMVSRLLLKKLNETNYKTSLIARGVPIGSSLDYVDSLTLKLAINNRKKF